MGKEKTSKKEKNKERGKGNEKEDEDDNDDIPKYTEASKEEIDKDHRICFKEDKKTRLTYAEDFFLSAREKDKKQGSSDKTPEKYHAVMDGQGYFQFFSQDLRISDIPYDSHSDESKNQLEKKKHKGMEIFPIIRKYKVKWKLEFHF